MTTRYGTARKVQMHGTARAFISGKSARSFNSNTDGGTYWLHGHAIATKYGLDGRWVLAFDWCGHYTPTTTNHINAILHAAGASTRVSYAAARRAGQTRFEVAV